MTRHDNGDRVCAVCKADGAHRRRLAEFLGQRIDPRRHLPDAFGRAVAPMLVPQVANDKGRLFGVEIDIFFDDCKFSAL